MASETPAIRTMLYETGVGSLVEQHGCTVHIDEETEVIGRAPSKYILRVKDVDNKELKKVEIKADQHGKLPADARDKLDPLGSWTNSKAAKDAKKKADERK